MAKNITLKTTEETFRIGNIITYEQQGQVMLGVVTQMGTKKYTVLNEKGSELELPYDRLYKIPSNIPAELTAKVAQANFLTGLKTKILDVLASFSLEDIWTFVVDENNEYTTTELTELYFADNSLEHHLTMRMALLADNVFFKRKKDTFIPRSTETVEELKKAEETRSNKQKRQEQTIKAFIAYLRDSSQPLPESANTDLQLLKNFAAANDDYEYGRTNEARNLLALCLEQLKLDIQGTKEEQAFKLLKKLGVFNQNTNLSLIRHAVRTEFSEAQIQEALSIEPIVESSDYPDKKIRQDLTDLYTVTIDDESTQDMDDAISMEKVLGGYNLGVHISDVASVLPTDSILDKEAAYRTTSLYFPSGTIPMLPYELSHNTCSLIVGQNRPCISCVFELDEAFEIKAIKIFPSLINVKRKYSYDEADVLLENGDEFLNLFYQATVTNETKRYTDGGFKISKKEVYLVLNEDGTLELKEFDEDSLSRTMIGETAIMANAAMAKFAKENNIPVIYRGQEAPDETTDNIDSIPEGLAKDYVLRSQLKPSQQSFTPVPHHTLGVEQYIQATSPIRRYIDLCNQRQILSFLQTGKPLNDQESFQNIIDEGENARSNAMTVNKETRRFWFLRYLQQRAKKNQFIEATVLRCDRKIPLIELHEVFLPTIAKLNQKIAVGDVVKLKIVRINPQFDDLRLDEVTD